MTTQQMPQRFLPFMGVLLLAACGSDTTAPDGGRPAVSVSVVPTTARLLTSGIQDFTATVANDATSSGVTWSITGCRGGSSVCGSLSNVTSTTATYTAPMAVPPGTLGVAATSVKDNSKSFTATVAIAAIGAGGSQITFFRCDSGACALYLMNADGTGLTRLTAVRSHSYLEGPLWSPDGTEIAFDSDGLDSATQVYVAPEVYVVNADGSGLHNLTNNPAADYDPVWSPDGSKIAFDTHRDGNWRVYVMNADGSGLSNLTNNPGGDVSPAWSPDGTKIAFISGRDGNAEVYVMNADGTAPVNLTNNPAIDGGPVWSPDGTKIAFVRLSSDDTSPGDIYVMNADGSSVRNLTNNPADDHEPVWSPDGAKIAFATYRDAYRGETQEIYVMNADGSGLLNLTNNPAFDDRPLWSPDGTKILFVSNRDGNTDIYVINPDGSGLHNLTNNPASDFAPAWRP
jgi:Tol biopolymer transport system component